MSARVNPHRSYQRLVGARAKKASQVERKGRHLERVAVSDRDWDRSQALIRRGLRSGVGGKRGTHTEGPIGRLPNPDRVWLVSFVRRDNGERETRFYVTPLKTLALAFAKKDYSKIAKPNTWKVTKERPNPVDEWDDETLNEAARLGSTQARALGKAERASRSGPRYFNVTWFSPTKQKRVGFIRPIEATSAADAKRQAKAMVTNEKAVNVVAKEARGNPDGGWYVYAQMSPDKKFSKFWYADLDLAKRFAASVIVDGGKTLIKAVKPDKRNPGIMELAGGLQALDYLGEKVGVSGRRRKRNAEIPWERINTKKLERLNRWIDKHFGNGSPRFENLETRLQAQVYRQVYPARKRRNPSVNEMSERFQGRATGKTEDYYFSDSAPRLDMSRGGKLVFLKLKGTTIRVPASVVAIDPKTEKLWLGSKSATGMFKRKANKGERLDYGDVDAICYLTAKAHVGNGKQYEYVHTFGEDGGRKPRLLIDHEGMPILQGGDYKIEDRGIVN